MKKILFTILATICCLGASAQYNYSNQWAINASGGITGSKGWGVSVGANTVFGLSMSSLQLNFNYVSDKVVVIQESDKIQMITLDVFYAYSFDKIIKSDMFHINIGGGLVAGYELIPQSRNGVVVTDSGGFRYGFGAKIQPEFKVNKAIGLFLEPKYTYLINANNPHQFLFTAGIKYYLN